MSTLETVEEWRRLDELLADSTHNLPLVACPEDCEEWKLLRPATLSDAAAGSGAAVELSEAKIWLPDAARGFVEAPVLSADAHAFTVKGKAGEVKVPRSSASLVNPGELEQCEDMANLVDLSPAAVLHNLRQRFRANLSHTWSGLFCISINPWKRLPIYTPAVVRMYKGQEPGRMPPHIYAVADAAYNAMLHGSDNQAILITGESGAGKTVNTKQLLFYLGQVAGRGAGEDGVSLEDQIMQSNPLLESFGNAKTMLNDNSSRFGKFTRLIFDKKGKVCGAEMESYLLEKSRVHSQHMMERGYHIFYQLCSKGKPELKASLGLEKAEATDYRFLSNSMNEVDTLDDAADMGATDRALSVLGLAEVEKLHLYRITAGVLLLGELRFMQRSGGDQAYAHGIEEPKLVAEQLGINVHKLLDAITTPMIRVGETLIAQTRNLDQVLNSVSAVAKGLYERAFGWLIARCNACLRGQSGGWAANEGPRADLRYIGILDISGFESFPLNSFEQICINYTNEKLQQFFNHRMYKAEQEEYACEGLKWSPSVDESSHLQPAIDLIERPMNGLFSLLEEECFVPKGSETALLEKLHSVFLGADGNAAYGKPAHRKDETAADFTVDHYAGKVNYSIFGWLEKNKNPLSESLVQVFAESANPILRSIWGPVAAAFATSSASRKTSMALVSQQNSAAAAAAANSRKSSVVTANKKGSFATVASTHKEQLGALLASLTDSQTHFVRCLVPNRDRRPGQIDPQLLLHQLRSGGVLDGIRAAREGFPSRLLYEDVSRRFRLLDSEGRDWTKSRQAAAAGLLSSALGFAKGTEFQLGTTKVFLRLSVRSRLERLRMDRISAIVAGIQAHIRAKRQRDAVSDRLGRSRARVLLQRNVRHFAGLQVWEWWRAYLLAKPMGSESLLQLRKDVEDLERERSLYAEMLAERERERRRLEEQLNQLQAAVDRVLRDNSRTQEELSRTKEEKDEQDLLIFNMHENITEQSAGLNSLKSHLDEEHNRIRVLQLTNQQLHLNLAMLERSLVREKESREQLVLLGLAADANLRGMERQIAALQSRNAALATDLTAKTSEAGRLSSRVADLEDTIARLREIIRRQQQQLFALEQVVVEERDERRKVERRAREVQERLERTTTERDAAQVELAVQLETAKIRDAELSRLSDSLAEERRMHAQQVEYLRGKHADSVATLQDQVQGLSKSGLRLETERATLESVLERRREEEAAQLLAQRSREPQRQLRRGNSATTALDTIRIPMSDMGSVSPFRKISGGGEVGAGRRVEELEREKAEMARELAAVRRQLRDHNEGGLTNGNYSSQKKVLSSESSTSSN